MRNETATPFNMNQNLKRSFESAVRDIYQVAATGKASPCRTPIARRARAVESNVNEEKRALTDAARALAQLWNVAPHHGR
jgi:hypothetical protein